MATTQGRKDITFPRQDIFKDANELAFERSFTSSRVELLNPVTAQNSKILSEPIAALWLETIQEIEAIGGRSRHIPEEGRTLDEDLQDASGCSLNWMSFIAFTASPGHCPPRSIRGGRVGLS